MGGRFLCRGVLWCLSVMLLQGCAVSLGGHIPPETFQFHGVVPYTPPGTGGWKVAQVEILLGRISRRNPREVWCDIEVGVPEVNWKGRVHDADAQDACALASDKAARFVLRQREITSAALCAAYRTRMRELLEEPIPGVDVTKFKTPGIRPERFP